MFCFVLCFVDLCFVLEVRLELYIVAGLQTACFIFFYLFIFGFVKLINKRLGKY